MRGELRAVSSMVKRSEPNTTNIRTAREQRLRERFGNDIPPEYAATLDGERIDHALLSRFYKTTDLSAGASAFIPVDQLVGVYIDHTVGDPSEGQVHTRVYHRFTDAERMLLQSTKFGEGRVTFGRPTHGEGVRDERRIELQRGDVLDGAAETMSREQVHFGGRDGKATVRDPSLTHGITLVYEHEYSATERDPYAQMTNRSMERKTRPVEKPVNAFAGLSSLSLERQREWERESDTTEKQTELRMLRTGFASQMTTVEQEWGSWQSIEARHITRDNGFRAAYQRIMESQYKNSVEHAKVRQQFFEAYRDWLYDALMTIDGLIAVEPPQRVAS